MLVNYYFCFTVTSVLKGELNLRSNNLTKKGTNNLTITHSRLMDNLHKHEKCKQILFFQEIKLSFRAKQFEAVSRYDYNL